MKQLFLDRQWNWLTAGIALGAVFFIAVMLVKPVGVSTQFVILDGVAWNMFSDDIIVGDKTAKSGYTSSNAYLNKSGGKYAKNVAHPLNYSFIFVLAMIAGGFIASRLSDPPMGKGDRAAPKVWRDRFGDSPGKRYAYAFIGGAVGLFGARLAGGCTSGHMMSGMMQTSLSGYLFAMGTFLTAIPFAIWFYSKKGE